MLTSALCLDLAFESTTMASVLAVPIVTLPIVAHPIFILFPFRVLSSTVVDYKSYGILSMIAGPMEVGFKGQEVGDNAQHTVSFLCELEWECIGSPFIVIREVGQDVEIPLRLFIHDVAHSKFIDDLVLG
jgi:hypothetical protein